jgi:hypothetical protein
MLQRPAAKCFAFQLVLMLLLRCGRPQDDVRGEVAWGSVQGWGNLLMSAKADCVPL